MHSRREIVSSDLVKVVNAVVVGGRQGKEGKEGDRWPSHEREAHDSSTDHAQHGVSAIAGYNVLRNGRLLLRVCPRACDSKGETWVCATCRHGHA